MRTIANVLWLLGFGLLALGVRLFRAALRSVL